MKRINYGLVMLLFLALWSSCGNSRTEDQNTVVQFDASAFSDKIDEIGSVQLVDVRTPGEFEKGHIENAVNIDWNSAGFDEQIKMLDREKPVFVYCLSGGRSGQAVEKLEKVGFEQIYEMPGGMMEWRANDLPEVTPNDVASGMTMQQYQETVQTDKMVLIDFYADWCAPCKKMEPFLDKIAEEMGDHLTLVRIDADANPALCQELGVEALPYLRLYSDNTLQWEHLGFMDEHELRERLN